MLIIVINSIVKLIIRSPVGKFFCFWVFFFLGGGLIRCEQSLNKTFIDSTYLPVCVCVFVCVCVCLRAPGIGEKQREGEESVPSCRNLCSVCTILPKRFHSTSLFNKLLTCRLQFKPFAGLEPHDRWDCLIIMA